MPSTSYIHPHEIPSGTSNFGRSALSQPRQAMSVIIRNDFMAPFDPSAISAPGEETVRIREMTIDDFPKVFHIGEEIFTAEYSQSLYRTWDEYEITTLFNSDNELCLVAESGAQIVGFALGTTVEKHNSPWKYGYLVWLGVCRDIQQGGVGSVLFKEIKRRMKEQGVRIIMIDTSADNQAAIRFFRKQGFGDVQEHVYMTLNLTRKKKKTRKKKP